MAETFVAVRRGPGEFEQHVCIKRILPAYESDPDFVDSFLREAKTSAALRHANIVQVLDFGFADGAHYLALELIDGVDLRALLGNDRQRARLDPELATLITAEVCAALEHAHATDQGRPQVIHRDISPSNVLLSRAGEVKLTDFGIARAVGGSYRTATGVIKGKLPYVPPEYVEGQPFDERGDLFSLGVMLYELLCGQRPFDGESDLDTIRRIAIGTYRPLREAAPDTPEQLVICVERLLATDPDARFQSARELVDALPPVATHKVRRRLGELVRARIEEERRPADPLAGTLASPSQPPRPITPSAPPPSWNSQTRTATRPLASAGRPSPRALSTLAIATAALVVVLAVALFRRSGTAPSVAATPSAPSTNEARDLAASTPSPPAIAKRLPTEPPAVHGANVDSEAAVAPQSAPEDAGSAVDAGAAARPVRQPRETGELKVVVHPFGDVWIDGKALGQAPINIKLSPGKHSVAVGDGRPGKPQLVVLAAGDRKQLELRRSLVEHD